MTDVARRPSLSDPSLYINRELSWLAFNDRVLAQARDERHPLLERVRFVSISETNLDEFFMIRVAGLQQQVASELPNPVPDGMTPEEQLFRIHDHTEDFFAEPSRRRAYASSPTRNSRRRRRRTCARGSPGRSCRSSPRSP
jgi:polyphosphate kinase